MNAYLETTDTGRIVHLYDLPGSLPELDIEITYVGESSVRKAICLDNVVIPLLLQLINQDPS